MNKELINQAYKVGKLSKRQARSLIEELYIEAEDYSIKYALASLYRGYLPPVPKVAKTPLDWVGKAVSKDGARASITYLYYDADNQVIVGTDGNRLHYTKHKIDSEESTYISFCGSPIDVNSRFPDYQRIIPNLKKLMSVNIEELSINLMGSRFEKKDFFFSINTPNDGTIHINKKYLEEALNGEKVFNMKYNDNKTPIKIEHELGVAIILPLN